MSRHKPQGILINLKLVLRSQGRVLTLKYPDNTDDVPGGHLEFGEDVLAALRRELKEEIGFVLRQTPTILGVWSDIRPAIKKHRITIGFVLDIPYPRNFVWIEKRKHFPLTWLRKHQVESRSFRPPHIKEMLLAAFRHR